MKHTSSAMKFCEQVLKYCIVIFVGIMAGFILLMAVYALPLEKMKEHAAQSVEMLTKEGDYPRWAENMNITTGDQFTDAIMIKTAVIDTDRSLVDKALLLPYIGSRPEVSSVIETVRNEKLQNYGTYARYWGGYLIVLKPLLLFFNVQQIRIFSLFTLGILSFIAVMLIRDKFGNYFSFAFLITILFLNPISIVLSMQYKNIYCIALITTIVILLLDRKEISDKSGYIFLINGICVAFFDFLTYPILALCLPLAVYLLLHRENIREMFLSMLKRCFLWGAGYGAMWVGNWVLASILTEQNVLDNGFKRILYRSSSEHEGMAIRYADIIDRIFRLLDYPVFYFLGVALLIGVLIYCIRKRNLKISVSMLPFIIIGALPFLWYAFAKNHSYIHPTIVYRGLGGTLFGILCVFGVLVNADKQTER